MTALWLNSQSERLVAAHLADTRPSWLWAAESEKLIWRSRAARAYEAANRRHPDDTIVPVPRQIARAVRLGVPLRASRSRLQFSLGRKPLAETCACTPVYLSGNVSALLVVMTDPVPDAALAGVSFDPDNLQPFTGAARHYVLIGGDGSILFAGGAGHERLRAGQPPAAEFAAGTEASRLMLFPDEEPQAGIPEKTQEASATTTDAADEAAPGEQGASEGLLELLDRLAGHKILYEPLDEGDDVVFEAPPSPIPAPAEPDAEPPDAPQSETPVAPQAEAEDGSETEAEVEVEVEDGSGGEPAAATRAEDAGPQPLILWRVLGRGLRSHKQEAAPPPEVPPTPVIPETDATESEENDAAFAEAGAPPPEVAEPGEGAAASFATPGDVIVLDDIEAIERASRYNFDELSRILTGRVAGEGEPGRDKPELLEPATPSSLISLGDETLILNRLPLGLLVFHDQKILFSNRALIDLLGYESGISLRLAGLNGVFPPDGDHTNVGPVTRLMGADGRAISVAARLQSISWQGKPALLLSASRQQEPLNAEALARDFAKLMSTALECGYFETSRAGILTSVSGRGANLVRRSPDSLIGRPIHGLIALNQGARLRSFLEQPARFAGIERPMLHFAGVEPDTEVILFAEGMAGIVTGYFGLLRRTGGDAGAAAPATRIDPGFLIQLGRAIRQPVNAIVGFAEIIRDQAFGPVGNDRYVDYARFIRAAGRDVAGVVDEIEHYARLGDSEAEVPVSRIDLIELLETSVARVRPYAASMRILVRSGISQSLPPISADPDTLTQAVLNLLASAVAHSPSGGQVVLSAKGRADGAVEIHIRDSANGEGTELDERFMVFHDGRALDGEALKPVPSAIGLTLTKSLLAVNAFTLEVNPGPGTGTLISLVIPAELVIGADTARK